ncbi:MAG: GNAT family N-acetyltransferase [Candidatus Dormibacteria bacterium]
MIPIEPAEWARQRQIRLRALAESPGAFGASLASEQAQPDSFWKKRATRNPDRKMWSARVEDEWIGLVGAVRLPGGQIELVSMWVEPGWRRQGVARALIEAVVGWHRQFGGAELLLWVSEDSPGARRCYEREGFRLTGLRLPLPSEPPRDRLEMRYSDPRSGQ